MATNNPPTYKKPISMQDLMRRFVEEKKKASSNIKPNKVNLAAVYKEVDKWRGFYSQIGKKTQDICQKNLPSPQDLTASSEKEVKSTETISDWPNFIKDSYDELKSKYDCLERRFNQMDVKNSKLRARNTLLERDKEAIVEELERLKDEHTSVSLEINRLRGLNSSLKSRASKMKTDVQEKTGNDLALMQSVNAQLKHRNNELQLQINELRNKLASGDRINEDAVSQQVLMQESARVESLHKDISELKQVIQELEHKNVKIQKEAERNLNENWQSSKTLTDLKNENGRLRANLKEHEERYKKIKVELDTIIKSSHLGVTCTKDLQMENANLKQHIEILRKNLEQKEQDVEKMLAKVSHVDNLQCEYEKLVKRITEQRQQLKHFEEYNQHTQLLTDENNSLNEKLQSVLIENCDLHKTVDELIAIQDELSSIKDTESELKQKVVKLEAENKQLKFNYSHLLDDVKKKAHITEETNNSLKQKNQTLEIQIQELRLELNKSLDHMKSKATELTKLQMLENKAKLNEAKMKEEIDKLRKQNSELSERDEISAKTLSEYQNRDGLFRQKISWMENEMNKLKSTLDEVNHGLLSKTDELVKVNQKLQEMQKTKDVNDKEYEYVAKGTMDYLKDMVSQLQQDNNNMHRAYQCLAQENNSLKSQKNGDENATKQTIEKLETTNKELKAQLDQDKTNAEEVQMLCEEIDHLKQNLTTLSNENKSLRTGYEKLRANTSTINLNDKVAQFRQRISVLENDNTKLKTELDSVTRELRGNRTILEESNMLKRRISQMQSDVDNQKGNYDAALFESNKLREVIAHLQQNIKNLQTENMQLKRTACPKIHKKECEKSKVEQNERWQMQRQVEDLQARLDVAYRKSEAGDHLLQENKQLKIRMRDLEVDLELLRRELENYTDEVQTAEKRIGSLTTECGNLKQINHRLRVEREKMKRKYQVQISEDSIAELSES